MSTNKASIQFDDLLQSKILLWMPNPPSPAALEKIHTDNNRTDLAKLYA
jgi:hypothetical protein